MPATELPLPTLLSWVLVAFTVEIDNEFEQRMPHRTTASRRAGEPPRGPWLVSWPTWATLLQYVDDAGTTVAELERRGFLARSVLRGRNPGVVRWGYVSLAPDPADARPRPPVADWLVRPTAAGARAGAIWADLPALVEQRWATRHGDDRVHALRAALTDVVTQVDVELPDYLPENAAHGGRVEIDLRPRTTPPVAPAPLPTLLAHTLLRFTMDAEPRLRVSLGLAANPLRVLTTEDERTADLPRRTGVAPETLAVMLGQLERRRHVVSGRAGRTRTIRLSASGAALQARYAVAVGDVEATWRVTYGASVVDRLRGPLEALVGDDRLARSPLRAAVEAPPGCWRAAVPAPEVLPHHPVVSHRGGYPDGS